jgi:excisionase family DNA binding protein
MNQSITGLLSVREATDYLGISPWTVYSWTSQGRIPRTKIGRRTMFRRQDLDQMIEANTGFNGQRRPQPQGD